MLFSALRETHKTARRIVVANVHPPHPTKKVESIRVTTFQVLGMLCGTEAFVSTASKHSREDEQS